MSEGEMSGFDPRITASPEGEEVPETDGLPKYGSDVIVRSFWGRHAQKNSGEVTNGNNALSNSSISERGRADSRQIGEDIVALKDGAKSYSSNSPRTRETLDNILQGYQAKNPDAPIRGLRVRDEITMDFPPAFLALYDSKFTAERTKIMEELGFDPTSFKTLNPDLQQNIAEKAEEPVLREWLQKDSELNLLYPPDICASKFAEIFYNHSARIAPRLNSGSKVDLFHNTHKSMMEPFWISGVLIRVRDGKRIEKLEELGGSAEVLEQWQSVASTDQDGLVNISVNLRGVDYIVDRERLVALSEEASKDNGL